jgi:hypothetical protein
MKGDQKMKPVIRTVGIAVSLALGTSIAFPEPAHASFWNKVKKTAKKATKAVTSTANKVADELEDMTEVDDVALDATTSIGKEVKKVGNQAVLEVKDGKDVVGHVYVEGGKIVATEYNDGKKLVKEIEKGPKYLVKGSEIVGQEVVVNGKVVGNTIIKNGKVVGHAVVAGGEYVVKEGMIVLNAINAQLCKQLVGAIKGGTKISSAVFPEISGFTNKMLSKSASLKKAMSGGPSKTVVGTVTSQIKGLDDVMAEAQRIAGVMNANSKAVGDIFTASTLCDSSPSQLEAKLNGLGLKPKLPARGLASSEGFFLKPGFFIKEAHAANEFYMAYYLAGAGAAGAGVTTSLSVVTNYKGKTGAFFAIGPMAQTNVAAGASFGIQFFPAVDLNGFKEWGSSVALAGGPFKIVSGGLDASFSTDFKQFQGVGISVGVGAGILPVDGSYAATYSWKLK